MGNGAAHGDLAELCGMRRGDCRRRELLHHKQAGILLWVRKRHEWAGGSIASAHPGADHGTGRAEMRREQREIWEREERRYAGSVKMPFPTTRGGDANGAGIFNQCPGGR